MQAGIQVKEKFHPPHRLRRDIPLSRKRGGDVAPQEFLIIIPVRGRERPQRISLMETILQQGKAL